MQTWLSELHYRMARYKPALKITQSNHYSSFTFKFHRDIQFYINQHL